MYLMRTRARTPERSVESIRRRVAEKALCEAEGRRRAKRLRRCGAGIGASSGSRIGLGSSFAVTGLVGLILSVGLMLVGGGAGSLLGRGQGHSGRYAPP